MVPLLEERAFHRADRAARCSPLRRAFFDTLLAAAVSQGDLCSSGSRRSPLTRVRLQPAEVDPLLRWLLRVGLLRREVDGQGLTDRVRLTPLGRRVVQSWPADTIPPASLLERLLNGLQRWLTVWP